MLSISLLRVLSNHLVSTLEVSFDSHLLSSAHVLILIVFLLKLRIVNLIINDTTASICASLKSSWQSLIQPLLGVLLSNDSFVVQFLRALPFASEALSLVLSVAWRHLVGDNGVFHLLMVVSRCRLVTSTSLNCSLLLSLEISHKIGSYLMLS
jgi:hypothetical protein